MADFAEARRDMVARQIAGRGIADPVLLKAMGSVPREAFVPPDLSHHAYADGPLPIGAGQTISQPYIVALMIEAAGVSPGARVLEIGAGSGYAAAVMGRMGAKVIAIERHADLAEAARARLARLALLDRGTVDIRIGDGSGGAPSDSPFDAILAAASGTRVPDILCDQLAPGGRLVMPVGAPGASQHLLRVTRREGGFTTDDLGAVRFVPLIGKEGWPDGLE